jgi:hypothetical protein
MLALIAINLPCPVFRFMRLSAPLKLPGFCAMQEKKARIISGGNTLLVEAALSAAERMVRAYQSSSLRFRRDCGQGRTACYCLASQGAESRPAFFAD